MSAPRIFSRVVGGAMEVLRTSFPKTVRVETTNHCNAACTFCPRETIGREKTFMKPELYEKIVDECVSGGCRTLHLHNFGEPLLDKRLPEWIRLAKQRGIPTVKIFSNGALLSGKMAEGLLDSGLDEIKISIDGADAQEFNELRIGLKHDLVVNNTRDFRRLRDERGSGPQVVAACSATSDKRQTEEMLEGVVDGIDFARLHNWAGSRKFLGRLTIRKPCERLWRSFTVLVNGDVALCCLDHSGREVLGNCVNDKIIDVWNNHRYQELRKLHKQSRQDEIPLCSNCSKCYLVGAQAAA